MAYNYVAIAPTGDQVRGSVNAATEDAAEQVLWQSGYRVVSLRSAWTAPRLDHLIPTLFGVKPQEVISFSRQMATLLESGIAVLPSLELLGRQARPALGRVLNDMAQAIKEGAQFSEAVAAHPQVFPLLFSRMVAVGERTGNIEIVLRQAATRMEKEQAVVKRIRGALALPAFTIVLAMVVVGILVSSALPPLTALFEDFDAELPLPTRILLGVTHFTTAYKMHMLFVLVAVVGAAVLYLRQPQGRRQFDAFLLRAPVLGPVTVASNATRFSGTMAVLFQAGLPLTEIMDLVLRTTQNKIVHEALEAVRDDLLRGEGLAAPLARTKVFPPMLVHMVEIGEQTGTTDTNLAAMSDFYATEVDEKIGAATSLIAPTLTLAVGGIVGFIAVSVIMPMYDIMQAMR